MMTLILPVLAVTIPLMAAFVLAFVMMAGGCRSEASEKMVSRLSLLAGLASFAAVSWLLVSALAGSLVTDLPVVIKWFDSGKVSFSLMFDVAPVTLAIAVLFAVLLLLVLRFSVNYLHREKGFARFFMIYNLFFAAMMMIVLSGNATSAFFGWKLVGISSYLLIGYSYERQTATVNATRVLVTNRLGDAGFILSLVLVFYWVGSDSWDAYQGAGLNAMQSGLVLAGLVLAAMVKSAQVPFSAWLGRALEGPTPSSAIFYGSLMVHAGILLLLKLAPAIDASVTMQVVLVVLGALTVLYGWIGGLVQTDVKTAIIFSTLTQTGLMTVAIGLGWYELATILMAAHAIWRAWQMLHAPAYLTLVNRAARPVPKWLQNRSGLFNAALQRFWLDHMTDMVVVRPTRMLAQDLNHFDESIISRMVGMPSQVDAISSLRDYEERKRNTGNVETGKKEGTGIFGVLLEKVANGLHWFEESLVLKGSGDGLVNVLRKLGRVMQRIDYLFSRPRYLWLIIILTLLVVL